MNHIAGIYITERFSSGKNRVKNEAINYRHDVPVRL